MKKILKFCRIAIRTTPLLFCFNMIYIFIVEFSKFGITYTFRMIINALVQCTDSNHMEKIIIYPLLLLLVFHMLGGNNQNFLEMLSELTLNKAKKIFTKLFMFKSYIFRQDVFYDSKFYDNYTFVKDHIQNTTDISAVIFNKLVSSLLSFIISITAVIFFSPMILCVMIVSAVIMIFINRYTVKKKVELIKKSVPEERKAGYYSDELSGKENAKELRIFHSQKLFLDKWSKSYKSYMKEQYSLDKKLSILQTVPLIVQQVLFGVIDMYLFFMIYQGKMTVGDFTFLFGMMLRLMQELNNLIDIFSKDIAENQRYITQYEEFTGPISNQLIDQVMNYRPGGKKESFKEFNELKIENLTYRYPNQRKDAVHNISLKIHRGEIVSILGYNGSGKSTLSKLICGLLENYEGKISINNIDIREKSREELYQLFGIAFQDFARYSLSLRENIGFGKIEQLDNEHEIRKAGIAGNIQPLIKKLPNGLESILGKEYDNSGTELSGGQWQKVILSRAYMGNPEILILDEPTASIDPLEEVAMLNHFKEIIEDRTAILISHRIGFARLSDRILFMENGRIIEDGSHEELIQKHGKYFELFQAQQNLYKTEEMPNA